MYIKVSHGRWPSLEVSQAGVMGAANCIQASYHRLKSILTRVEVLVRAQDTMFHLTNRVGTIVGR